MKWFRFYSEALHDPKVQSLPAEIFKIWVNILCVACNLDAGRLPSVAELAFSMRLPELSTGEALVLLEKAGLLDIKRNQHSTIYYVHGWEKRQCKSDSSTERVKRFRNASETAQTRGDKNREEESRAPPFQNGMDKAVYISLSKKPPHTRTNAEDDYLKKFEAQKIGGGKA